MKINIIEHLLVIPLRYTKHDLVVNEQGKGKLPAEMMHIAQELGAQTLMCLFNGGNTGMAIIFLFSSKLSYFH